MRKRELFLLFVVLTTILCVVQVWAEPTDVFIDTSMFASRKINVGVVNFTELSLDASKRSLGVEFTKIVKNDLQLSGYFTIIGDIEQKKFQYRELVDYAELSNLGVGILINGTIKIDENEKVIAECYVFDVASQKRIFGLRYTNTPAIFRRMAHDFSNEVIFRLTGDKGIAHTRICFVGEKNRKREVYVVDYDGYNLAQVTKEDSLVLLPKWEPKGEKIIYTSYKEGNPDLYSIYAHGGGRKMLSGAQGLNAMGRFSPDGEKIAIVMNKDGNPEIYLLNSRGTLLQRLTNNKAIDVSPAWSPGNRDLVFVSDRSGVPQLYVMDSDGVNVRRLTYTNIYTDSPDWSITGERIAFVMRNRGEYNIYTTDVNGTITDQLTRSTARNENPSFSPDGRFIVFVTNRRGQSELFVMNNDGSNQRPFFPDELKDQFRGEIYTPCWSQ